MNKKEKQARKLIKKLNKKREKKALKKLEKQYGFAMYIPAGCSNCKNGQIRTGGGGYCSVVEYNRCGCSKVKTKKYRKFLKNQKNMIVKDAAKMASKFYDNNNHIVIGDNTDRDYSW